MALIPSVVAPWLRELDYQCFQPRDHVLWKHTTSWNRTELTLLIDFRYKLIFYNDSEAKGTLGAMTVSTLFMTHSRASELLSISTA